MTVVAVRGSGDPSSAGDTQTATVSTGDVTASVSANGNVAAGTTVNADFQGSGGVVEAILVEPGDKVRKGQALARVDQTSARQSLAQASAQLSSAQAAYATTVQGQTPQEEAMDATSIQQAEVSVGSARENVRAAQQ